MKRHSPGRRLKRCKILLGRSTTLQKRFWRCCRNTSVFFARWMPGFLEIFRALVWGTVISIHAITKVDNVSPQNHPQLGSNWDSSENRTHWGLTSKLSTEDSVHLCATPWHYQKWILTPTQPDRNLTCLDLFRFCWNSRRRFGWMLSNCFRAEGILLLSSVCKACWTELLFLPFFIVRPFWFISDVYLWWIQPVPRQSRYGVDEWLVNTWSCVECRIMFGVQFRFFCILRQSRRILWRNQRWSCLLRRLILSGPQ